MSRYLLIAVLAGIMFLAVAAPSVAGGFDDVPPDHWAYSAVQYLYNKGVLQGDEWGKFNGDESMSRYEFAVAVARIINRIEDYESAGGYDVDGEIRELTGAVMAIAAELEDEFAAEMESIRVTLEAHGAKIDSLEENVEEIRGAVGDVADAVAKHKIIFNADARLRFEGKYMNDDSRVQRPNMRFRLAMDAPVNDEVKFHASLASGSSAGPTSTNQTFQDEFEKKPLWIDRAYLEWQPSNLEGWKFLAGKFGPNWENTLITYDSDVNVEGIGQSYKSPEGFVVNLAELVPDEKGFYIIAQIGMEDLLTEGIDGYITYHYINDDCWQLIERKLKDGDLKNRFNFDRIDMDNYSAIDIIGRYSWDAGRTPMSLTGNYVRNLAGNAPEDLSGLQQAAWAQLKIGKAKDLGEFEGWVEWGKLQANSVLSFLTDAARGSSDHEFWGGGIKYRWMKNLDIAFTFIYADRLSKDEDYKLIQADILGKV